jgi:hypothetical protein
MCDSQNATTTQNHTEACCAAGEQITSSEGSAGRWLDGPDVLDVELPVDLQSALGQFVGTESIDTLGEWTAEIRRLTGGGSIAVEELCHAGAETDHWGEVGDERYYFQCFYDAIILAAIEERSVDIHTVSPDGSAIEARAVGSDELSVTPEDAVFSLGIDENAGDRSGGDPTLEDGYAAICPYVRAFPDREAYERWANEVPAATVALPLAGATDVAGALVA